MGEGERGQRPGGGEGHGGIHQDGGGATRDVEVGSGWAESLVEAEMAECSLLGWLNLAAVGATGGVVIWYTVETPVLRPVTVRPDPVPAAPPAAGPVLFTPQGLRIEELDRDTLIAVLRLLE
jgi:hypothetical protein